MKKNRICFFNSCKAWGGGEKWHLEIADLLNKRGRDIIVVSNPKSELFKKASSVGLKLYGIKISNLSFLNLMKMFQLVLFYKRNKIDAVILNLPADLKIGGLAAKIAGVKRIIYRRGSAIPIKNTFINRFLFKNIITDIIANSNETKETILLKNLSLFDKEKIRVIYNGLNIEEYNERKYKNLYKRENDEIIIGNAGRLVEQKGQRFLIDLAVILKDKGNKFKILIAGTGQLLEELKEYAEEKGVTENILFIGFVENIKSFMESIDIFVLTSLWEGFGYVLVEAMLSKKSIVAFNTSSNPELVEDGENGLLVEYKNISEMAQKVGELIDSQEMRERFGENGYKIAVKKFSIDRTIMEVEDVFSLEK